MGIFPIPNTHIYSRFPIPNTHIYRRFCWCGKNICSHVCCLLFRNSKGKSNFPKMNLMKLISMIKIIMMILMMIVLTMIGPRQWWFNFSGLDCHYWWGGKGDYFKFKMCASAKNLGKIDHRCWIYLLWIVGHPKSNKYCILFQEDFNLKVYHHVLEKYQFIQKIFEIIHDLCRWRW